MVSSNDKNIKLYQQIYATAKKYNIIDAEIPGDFIEGIIYMQTKNLLTLSPIDNFGYIPPVWIHRKNHIQFLFPTPPMIRKISDKHKQPEVNQKFINSVRKSLKEMYELRPKKLILDMRCNSGGFADVFYDALFPILPDYEGDNLYGINLRDKIVMSMNYAKGKFTLTINNEIEDSKYSHIVPMTKPLNRYKIPKIEIWVNEHTASSGEITMIWFKQQGFDIVGKSMGLTTGMLSKRFGNYIVNIPLYYFKDIHGNVYKNDYTAELVDPCPDKIIQILCKNVVNRIPNDVLQSLADSKNISSSSMKYIISEYLHNDSHAGIQYLVPHPAIEHYYNTDRNEIVIYIPPDCNQPLSKVLDLYESQVLSNVPVKISILGSRLKDDVCLKIFGSMLKPYEVKLAEASLFADPGSYYVSGSYPYVTLVPSNIIGKYANINATIVFNYSSISTDTYSLVLLRYLGWAFPTDPPFAEYENSYKYSRYRHRVDTIHVAVYTARYQ